MQENPAYICLCTRLIDKFADNGIVTVIPGEIISDEIHIRLWLMSCRVLKRGLENLMMNILVEHAKKHGVKKIVGYYFPTAKNGMVKDFYTDYGYHKIISDVLGNITFELNINDYAPKKTQILLASRPNTPQQAAEQGI